MTLQKALCLPLNRFRNAQGLEKTRGSPRSGRSTQCQSQQTSLSSPRLQRGILSVSQSSGAVLFAPSFVASLLAGSELPVALMDAHAANKFPYSLAAYLLSLDPQLLCQADIESFPDPSFHCAAYLLRRRQPHLPADASTCTGPFRGRNRSAAAFVQKGARRNPSCSRENG